MYIIVAKQGLKSGIYFLSGSEVESEVGQRRTMRHHSLPK